jgi:hypothetical protein
MKATPAAASAPEREPWFHPFAPYIVPLALAAGARFDAARALPFAAEDAYITFRYAEHWAHGLGPVYNAGERVFGFTSPLWTAWLALGAALGVDTFAWARAWGALMSLGALVLLVGLLDRTVSRSAAWAFGVFFAVFPLFAAHAVLGMETSLVLCLVAAAATAIDSRSGLAGPLLGLLALSRPEGTALALLLAVLAGGRARLWATAIFGAGLAALWAYYGNPIPQSVLAKAQTYGVGLRPFALDWIEGLVPAFLFPRWQTLLEAQHLFPLAILATPAAVVGLAALGRRRPWPALFAVAAGGILVLLGYTALGVPYFGWYFVLPLTSWAVAAAAGLPLLVRSRLVWAALAVYVLSDAPYLGQLYVGRNQVEARLFGDAAERLRMASGGHGTVFLEPIGHIGYRTGLTVIDEVGLVSPDVPRRRRRGAGWYADIIQERRPEYLVVRPGLIEQNRALAGVATPFRSLAERDSVFAGYVLVGEPPTAADQLVVLVRR